MLQKLLLKVQSLMVGFTGVAAVLMVFGSSHDVAFVTAIPGIVLIIYAIDLHLLRKLKDVPTPSRSVSSLLVSIPSLGILVSGLYMFAEYDVDLFR